MAATVFYSIISDEKQYSAMHRLYI